MPFVIHQAPVWFPVAPAPTAADVRAEAERKIDEGFLFPDGTRFRCDTDSMTRLDGFCAAFDDAAEAGLPAPTVTFRTAAGVVITLATKADAVSLRRAATSHISAVLTASSTLQGLDPIPTDYASSALWPRSPHAGGK